MSDPLHVHTKTESITMESICAQVDALGAMALHTIKALMTERDALRAFQEIAVIELLAVEKEIGVPSRALKLIRNSRMEPAS